MAEIKLRLGENKTDRSSINDSKEKIAARTAGKKNETLNCKKFKNVIFRKKGKISV